MCGHTVPSSPLTLPRLHRLYENRQRVTGISRLSPENVHRASKGGNRRTRSGSCREDRAVRSPRGRGATRKHRAGRSAGLAVPTLGTRAPSHLRPPRPGTASTAGPRRRRPDRDWGGRLPGPRRGPTSRCGPSESAAGQTPKCTCRSQDLASHLRVWPEKTRMRRPVLSSEAGNQGDPSEERARWHKWSRQRSGPTLLRTSTRRLPGCPRAADAADRAARRDRAGHAHC